MEGREKKGNTGRVHCRTKEKFALPIAEFIGRAFRVCSVQADHVKFGFCVIRPSVHLTGFSRRQFCITIRHFCVQTGNFVYKFGIISLIEGQERHNVIAGISGAEICKVLHLRRHRRHLFRPDWPPVRRLSIPCLAFSALTNCSW